MTYYADIKLSDEDNNVGFKVKNVKAEKGLAEAIKFLSQKDGRSTVRRVIEFLQRDFDEFERQLKQAIYKN